MADEETGKRLSTLREWTTAVSDSDRAFYEERRSPRLKEFPKAQLDAKTEIDWYISRFSSDYRAQIDGLDSQIAEGMSPNCRLCFVVPVADHREGKNIYHMLATYLKQKDKGGVIMDNTQFEILLLLNHPDNESPDNTKKEIERFKKAHPEISVRAAEIVFPQNTRFGAIVKILSDLAVVRSQKRTEPVGAELILARNDADMVDLSETYVSEILALFDDPNNRHVDAVQGEIKWSEKMAEIRRLYPVAHTAYRYRDLIRQYNRMHNLYTEMQGANLIIRSSTYAAIGGFNEHTGISEDTEIAKMIKLARFGKLEEIPEDKSPIAYSEAAWVITDPRRVLYCARNDISMADKLYTYGAGVSLDAKPRKIAAIQQLPINLVLLEDEINKLNENSLGIKADSPAVKTALEQLGFRFKIIDGEIKITSGD